MPELDFVSIIIGYVSGLCVYHMIVTSVFNKEDSLY